VKKKEVLTDKTDYFRIANLVLSVGTYLSHDHVSKFLPLMRVPSLSFLMSKPYILYKKNYTGTET